MTMQTCDRCFAYAYVFRLINADGSEEWLCRRCLWDEHYAASGGKIPQGPEDAG